MASFLKDYEKSVTVGNTIKVTLKGGGPKPLNLPLDVVAEKPNLVDITRKDERTGPFYDWELLAKYPGETLVHAELAGTRQRYSVPFHLTIKGRINIIFNLNGEGMMECVGLGTFPILGQPGRGYPKSFTVDPYPKHKDPKNLKSHPEHVAKHWSKEYGVYMPWATLIWGAKGIYIHEMPDTIMGNGGNPSAGCIHVGPANAKTVYDYLETPALVTITYPWRVTL